MNHADQPAFNAFLPFMPDVGQCARSLDELNTTWRLIEASAKMHCGSDAALILPTMAAARSGFNALEQDLVRSLVTEKVATAVAEISTKAQYVIDIIVRNLYERTADVGFLATDAALCAFVAGLDGEPAAIRQRLADYRSKYTVYNDILLLGADGRVLLRLEDAPLAASSDPLVAAALQSDSYVEAFGPSDLQPARRQSLIYGKRMLHPQTGAAVGVLCLCFDFEREMAGIFATHGDAVGRYNMLLLDDEQRVIASADADWIAPGAKVPVNHAASHRLQMYCGRLHLIRTVASRGYQGYAGPAGWCGQVMMPLDVAFYGQDRSDVAASAPELVLGLQSHSKTFCPPLHAIRVATDTVRRTVWNGQVLHTGQAGSGAPLSAIIEQIGDAGARSNALFEAAGNDLSATAIGAGLDRAAFTAELMADLLERNLYERANDCRWWALAPLLRGVLAQREPDDAALRAAGDMLAYINSLYTVYTRIVVYGVDGRILAESVRDAADAPAVGTDIDAGTLQQVLALRTAQDYHVTRFVPSPLYGDRPAWVYHAAVRDPAAPASVVGGIGLVFDANAELGAMLRDGQGKAGGEACFVDRDGRVLASTAALRPAGAMLDIGRDLLAMERGRSDARLAVHDGQYAMLGCCAAQGYREFKTTDGYRDDVLAVVLHTHGALRRTMADAAVHASAQGLTVAAATRKYATFTVGGQLHAIAADEVWQAYPASAVAPVSAGAMPVHCGMLPLRDGAGVASYIWVADLGSMLGMEPAQGQGGQVVVVRQGEHAVGVLVDTLDTVTAFSEADVAAAPLADDSDSALVRQVIRNGAQLLPVVDAQRLRRLLEAA